jgi:hypothetical protein
MRGRINFEIVPAAAAAQFYFFNQMIAGAPGGLRRSEKGRSEYGEEKKHEGSARASAVV